MVAIEPTSVRLPETVYPLTVTPVTFTVAVVTLRCVALYTYSALSAVMTSVLLAEYTALMMMLSVRFVAVAGS